MREQFEKLPDIKWIIANFYFDADCNNYKRATSSVSYDAVAWINGAWYAFQEQQKKIDSISKYLIDSCGFDKLQVLELLK